ncbi:hypothetical protein UlMin_045566 [Ulmus minor]
MDVRSISKLPIYRNAGAVNIDSIAGGSESIEDDPQDEPALLLTWAVNDTSLNENVTDTTDSTFGDGSDLHEGQYFKNKKALYRKLTDVALAGNFEFRTTRSSKSLWVIKCVDPNCSWRLRASKVVEESPFFVIQKYVGVHSCSLLSRSGSHHQATYVMVGEKVASQYVGGEKGPTPKDVQTYARTHLNAKISYYKAWRGRKHAQSLIRGSPEQSFHLLPSYCYMLEKVNPGTITHIEVDGDNRFKYPFLAFGVAIKGFEFMRKVVGIDGTFLKSQYKGVLLVAMAQDGNGQCYPIAWAIVDSENEDAWTWFVSKLKEVIGDSNELAFISDRALSIKKTISNVFDKAHHGACAWHVSQNVRNKFMCADIMG